MSNAYMIVCGHNFSAKNVLYIDKAYCTFNSYTMAARDLLIHTPKARGLRILAQNSPELSLLKFLPLTYHHSHFLAATLDFTSFFTIAFSRATLLFLQLGCF